MEHINPERGASGKPKRQQEQTASTVPDIEAIGILVDQTHWYGGLSMEEIQRVSGQGLCIAAGKTGYLTCSICTGRGLMREFLSLKKSEVIVTRVDFTTSLNHA